MEKLTVVRGMGVPLPRANVDTDQIVPSAFLKRTSRTGYGDALFAEWRKSTGFVLNDTRYAGARVLVAGADFGTGSSREHAVWALRDYGFRVVISSRFADIFRGNAGKQGVLTAEVAAEDAETLIAGLEAAPGSELVVSLVDLEIRFGNFRCAFEIDEHTRWRLLNGLDDIDLTAEHEEKIAVFEASRAQWLPQISVE